MSTIKGRLSRLKALGLVKASEIGTDMNDRPRKPAPAERETFLPGWDKIASHTFTRTLETGFTLDGDRKGRFESTHFSNQRLRRKKGLDPEPAAFLPFDQLSFFDLETTGLSGGTGTIAFLAAVGFFEGVDFLITQVFMDDFPGEPPFLDFTINLLAQRPQLVTYNGAAFDLPLLRTRCIMNGVQVPEFRHIDVLQSTRRLWRRTLGSCSLQAMEAGVLGEGREDDIPGFLIPRLWLEYSGSSAEGDRDSLPLMAKVVDHNALDVKSLARLLLRIDGIMEEPLSRWAGEKVYATHLSLELIAAGRLEEGFALLEDAGASGDEGALWTLARLYRRAKEFDAYARVVEAMDDHFVESCVEKAKYHEHLRRDPAAALACAEKAFGILGSAGQTLDVSIGIKEALERRKARLISKLGE